MQIKFHGRRIFLGLSIVTLLATFSSCAYSHHPAYRPKIQTRAAYQWEPLQFKNGVLIQVGSNPLPAAVKFPLWLHPIGGKALVWMTPADNGSKSQFSISVFLPFEDSLRTQNWLTGYPKEFFLQSEDYSVLYGSQADPSLGVNEKGKWPVILHSETDKNYYDYIIVLLVNSNQLVRMVSGSILVPPGPHGANSKYYTEFDTACVSQNSPLPFGKQVINLTISYAKKNPEAASPNPNSDSISGKANTSQ